MTPASTAVPAEGPARHCWVRDPLDEALLRPGLLVEWRRGPVGGWEGRVVYATDLRSGGWGTVEQWVTADQLTTAP